MRFMKLNNAHQVIGVSEAMYAMDYPYQAKAYEVAAGGHFDTDDASKKHFSVPMPSVSLI